MAFVTLEQARTHCRADGEDDDLLQLYINAAEIDAITQLNRDVFQTGEELQDAIAAIPAAMVIARQERDDALSAADQLEDEADRCEAIRVARDGYQSKRIKWYQTRNGIVIDDHIRGAILTTIQHSYQNRSNVVAGQGAAAVLVPQTASWIYQQRRYMGELL